MEPFISPILLYVACALGAVGVALALPKKSFSPFIVGGLVAAAALGLLLVGLGVAAGPANLPNIHFYIFSAIALFGAIKVITHPRPVYSALFFILTILASCGLYLILSAEFMAFALVIVYAGAILITYLFVIMLATEAPSNEALEALSDYDRFSREPLSATIAGFVLLGALSSVLAGGAAKLKPGFESGIIDTRSTGDAALRLMPRKAEALLAASTDSEGKPMLRPGEKIAQETDPRGQAVWAIRPLADRAGYLVVVDEKGNKRQIPQSAWPKDLRIDNVEGVAFSLIGDKPGAIEIAGVILLMAMLAAVVLARKKVDFDEAATRAVLTASSPEGGRA